MLKNHGDRSLSQQVSFWKTATQKNRALTDLHLTYWLMTCMQNQAIHQPLFKVALVASRGCSALRAARSCLDEHFEDLRASGSCSFS
jgi:hypothetical protein